MAVTKIHPIKSTLKKALDYIENPAKTDEKMLVSSFACSYETADIEFELLLSQAMQKGNNLAHHLIQSFAPGETTPEQAHEIGRQLADEVLQGKYPYVLTTHIDKGHVHNHIIFCAVDMVNQRKYVSNRQSYAYIRRTSDRLCKEHGLSVIIPGRDKGKKGTVTAVHDDGKVVVEGINIVKKHVKPNPMLGQAGGIMDKTLPIEGSNVMLVNPKTGKGDRVGYKVVDGKKVRVFKSDGAVVGAKA